MAVATVGRLIAAVGTGTAAVAIWLDALGDGDFAVSYWNLDGTLGALLLALACLSALACAGALVLRRPAADLALGGIGAVLFGLYLFFPAALAFSDWNVLASGAWLGVCAGLIVIGSAVVLWGWGQERSTPEWLGLGVAGAGCALVMTGIWLEVGADGGTYWHPRDSSHGLGVLFLILVGLWAFATLGGILIRKPALLGLAAGISLVIFGLVLFIPATSAFGALDELRIGAWLPFAGGILLALGSALAPRLADEGAAL
jgi:hypothetical protein